ncbi:MAG TPA: site-specific integrase, partial [Thermodesulfobacteriota bacterium]|nr:site-specific integrase [Thermodesulfobacteriota bacterium]
DIVPYPVRHLKSKDVDRSLEKRRNDKLTVEEFEKVVQAFSQDVRLQAFLTLSFESLGRPQEILFTKIKDVELSDNYGKIWISEHGKEGTGFLEVIDSYPYVAEWLNDHPLKNNPEAFFFLNLGSHGRYEQLKPHTINKHLRNKLKALRINKPVTCYSLKRSGVTYRRLRGDSDLQIQHTARWTSTKQLKSYDLSQHDDTFKLELIKRGIIQEKASKNLKILSNKCMFCETVNGIGISNCKTCKRPLDRKKIADEIQQKDSRIDELEQQITNMPGQILKLLKENPLLIKEALKIEN